MSAGGDWPALILTAGLGTRLQPLSSARAKAALPIAGDVLIRRILRWLRSAGVTRVVVNLHHRPESITRRLGDGRDLDVEIRYSWEDPVLGSAGGPRRALSLLDAERFFIVNGDTVTDVDVGAVRSAHERSGAIVTMAVVPGDTARYGGVIVHGDGHVIAFSRGSSRSPLLAPTTPDAPGGPVPYHFIGVQAVDARAFAEVPDGERSETVGWLYPRLIARAVGSVRAYVSDAEFLDIGTPADYFATVVTIAARERRALDTGIGATIHPSAHVNQSILWDRVSVHAGASVVNCVLADDVVIPEGARFERQAIALVNGRLSTSPL